MKIEYKFSDGHIEEIEVTESVAAYYAECELEEKRKKWREEKRRDVSFDKIEDCLSSNDPDPLSRIIDKENRKEGFLRMLDILTDKQREAVELFYIQGLRKVQIASLLGITEKAVRKRIKGAMKKILKIFYQ